MFSDSGVGLRVRHLVRLARVCHQVTVTNLADFGFKHKQRQPESTVSIRNYIRLLGDEPVLKEALARIEDGQPIDTADLEMFFREKAYDPYALSAELLREILESYHDEEFRTFAEGINAQTLIGR